MTAPKTGAHLNIRQAAFIGVAAMVGAGIFSLLGAAGEVAGAAVWLSFLIAGAIAILQGYSFAKLGARYPSAGGMLEYVRRGFGDGHILGIVAWLLLFTNAIITAMVAVSFGSYASAAVNDRGTTATALFAVLLLVVMTGLNIVGSKAVARTQTVVVIVVIGILTVFAISTLSNLHPHLLAFSGYPSVRKIVSSVALTFFAFLGFGVITFTAKDLNEPKRQLPRAMFLALGIATVIYVAVSLGVFGTLSVEEVIASGGTALAVAAQPVLGRAGYWLMSVTALFATAGAANSGLYPAAGLCEEMAAVGQFPPVLGRRWADRVPIGLLLTSAIAIVLAAGFGLTAIASIGSAIALVVFALVTGGHLRIASDTGARTWLLLVAEVCTIAVLVNFAVTTLVHEPGSMIAIAVVLVLSVGLDLAWKRVRRQPAATTPAT
jgi:amino acid transporter